MMYIAVAVVFGVSVYSGTAPIAWWLLPVWIAATMVCAIVIGVGNGLIVGWLSVRSDVRNGAIVSADKLIGYTWIAFTGIISTMIGYLIIDWMH
jgi:hypothetical protein